MMYLNVKYTHKVRFYSRVAISKSNDRNKHSYQLSLFEYSLPNILHYTNPIILLKDVRKVTTNKLISNRLNTVGNLLHTTLLPTIVGHSLLNKLL